MNEEKRIENKKSDKKALKTLILYLLFLFSFSVQDLTLSFKTNILVS